MSTVFLVILEGSQEVPPRSSTASGVGMVVFDSEAVAATYSFDIQGLDFGPITSSQTPTDLNDVTNTHFHAQARGFSGSVVFGQITPNHDNDDRAFLLNADGTWSVSGRWETTDPVPITNFNAVLDDTFANALDSAAVGSEVSLYFNVHTVQFPGGELRGQLIAIADDIDDVETGTAGSDLLDGLNGNGAILGLAGDDTINGGNGNDVLDGSGGDDMLAGGNGDDWMEGGAGEDELDGHRGEDTVNGGMGDDDLTGGSGADLFAFNVAFGADVITDFQNNDRIQFVDELFASPEAVLAASAQVGDDTVITAGTNTVTLLGVELSSLQASNVSIVV